MPTTEQLRRLSTIAIVLIVLVVVATTLSPGHTPLAGGFIEDALTRRVVHFLMFAALGFAIAVRFAVSDAARRSPARTLFMMVLTIWIFASFTEIGQGMVPGRAPQLGDWLADMAGALTGLALAGPVMRFVLREHRRPTPAGRRSADDR